MRELKGVHVLALILGFSGVTIGVNVVFITYAYSTFTGEDVPRGLEFLFNRNRFNVAISRAKALAVVVSSPRLMDVKCRTVEQMRLIAPFENRLLFDSGVLHARTGHILKAIEILEAYLKKAPSPKDRYDAQLFLNSLRDSLR